MFNFFGRRKTAKDFVAEAQENYGLPEQKPMWSVPDPSNYGIDRNDAQPEPEKEKPMNTDAIYTIGVNEHGRVQLRIKLDYGSTTLTMNDEGTIDLIEGLAHAIRKRYKVSVEPIDNETDDEPN